MLEVGKHVSIDQPIAPAFRLVQFLIFNRLSMP